MIDTRLTLLDSILDDWREVIGDDFEGYRNHCRRMVSCCLALQDCDDVARQKLMIAAAFHDIGIWTDNTLDYLPPSVTPAMAYLKDKGIEAWSEEISLMITEHHKLSAFDDPRYPLVELFRKGDLVDFSLGLVRFGLPRAFLKELRRTWPNAGFHKRLLQLASHWFVRHPLNPAPMMKR
jgi:hypothetical protein